MKKLIFLLIIINIYFSEAQNVGIGDSSDFTPDGSAILELRSTSRGFLMPCMTRAERLAITTPAHGLMVIQTDNVSGDPPGIWWYSDPDSQWYLLTASTSTPWLLAGNSGTNPSTNFLGTTDLVDLVFRSNNTERLRIYSNGNVNISNSLTIGTGLTVNSGGADITGSLTLENTSGIANIFQTSSSQLVDVNYILPLTQGSASTFLMNDGLGNLSWSSPTVSSIPFSNITSGANTNQTLTVDNNSSLTFSGNGLINANQFNLYSGSGATNAVDLETNEINGVLQVQNGGTGLANAPLNYLLYGNNTDPLNTLAPPLTNSYLTSSGGAPSWSSIPTGGFLSGIGTANQVAYYNSSNTLTGSNDFIWDNSTKELTINGSAYIGGTSTIYNSSAWLDVGGVSSTAPYKGFLVPRMTDADRVTISSPAAGLLVYQTNSTPGFFYYDGTTWIPIATLAKAWSLTGNAGTNPTTDFIGTTDANDFVFKTNNTERMRIESDGNVGIGTINPSQMLEIANGNLLLGTNDTSTVELRFLEKTSQGTNYLAFKADTLNRDITLVWPKDTNGVYSILVNPGNNRLKWETTSDFAANIRYNVYVNVATTPYYVTDEDSHIIVNRSSDTYVILPSGSDLKGKVVFVKRTGTGSVCICPGSSRNIDGNNYMRLSQQYASVMLVYDGANNWYIMSTYLSNNFSGCSCP